MGESIMTNISKEDKGVESMKAGMIEISTELVEQRLQLKDGIKLMYIGDYDQARGTYKMIFTGENLPLKSEASYPQQVDGNEIFEIITQCPIKS